MELLNISLTHIGINEFTTKLRKTIIWKNTYKLGGGYIKLLSAEDISRFLQKNNIILPKGRTQQTINDQLYKNKNGSRNSYTSENSSEKVNLMSFIRILEFKLEGRSDLQVQQLKEGMGQLEGEKDEEYEKIMENSLLKDIRLKKFIMKYFEYSFNSERNKEIQILARDFQKNVECFVDLEEESENKKYYVTAVKKLISFLDSEGSEVAFKKKTNIFMQSSDLLYF